jgi:hypothetical protein
MSVLALVALVYLFIGFSWFMLNALIHRKRKLWWFAFALVVYTFAWPAMLAASISNYNKLQKFLKPFNKWTFVFTGQRKFKSE